MVLSLTTLPWALGVAACALSFGNAAFCTIKVIKASNGNLILMEHEDEESASRGSFFRKWFLISMFCSSTLRAVSIVADFALDHEVPGWYSGSTGQYVLQILPSCAFLANQSYLSFYLSYLSDEISGTTPIFSFPKVWIYSSALFTAGVLLLVLLQSRDLYIHLTLAAASLGVLVSLLYYTVGLIRTVSARVAMATRKVLLRIELLVAVSVAALAVLSVCRIKAAQLDLSHSFGAEAALRMFTVLIFTECLGSLGSLLLLVNSCLGLEMRMLSSLRRANSTSPALISSSSSKHGNYMSIPTAPA